MAVNISVNVETNGLGTAEVFYGSIDQYYNYAEVHLFPKFGVLIDYKYHYEYTMTYKPESERDPETIEGDDLFYVSSFIVQDENCPLAIKIIQGNADYVDTVSYKITITGNESVFPYKVIPDGSGDVIWFYRRTLYNGVIEFNWKCKVALDGYEFLRTIFFYSSDEQIPNKKYSRINDHCNDDGFAKCTFWFRKFTYLLIYDEKSKKLISNIGGLIRDGGW